MKLDKVPSLLTDRGIQLSAAGLCDFPISITHARGVLSFSGFLGRRLGYDDESTRSVTSVLLPADFLHAAITDTSLPGDVDVSIWSEKESFQLILIFISNMSKEI